MKTSSCFKTIAAAGIIAGSMMTPAQAGELGDDCCADLEERVAELEATTVRKGNRKVSVELYGSVTRALLFWNDDNGSGNSRSDLYQVDIDMAGVSRFGIKGGARINSDVSVGYNFEWQIGDTLLNETSPSGDDGVEAEGTRLRYSYGTLTSMVLGTILFGHASSATDGISEIDLSGTTTHARSDVFNSIIDNSFVSRDLFDNLDGAGRGDLVRYDSPTIVGFKVSGSFGESDFWDAALRYANQFGDFKVAAGVGYVETKDDSSGTGNSGGCGAVEFGSRPYGVYCTSGSGGIAHIPTGLNLNVATGSADIMHGPGIADDSFDFFYVKGGITQNFFGIGKTALYGEYWDSESNNNTANTTDEGNMWGGGFSQHIDAAAAEIFAGYRRFEENRAGDTTNDSYGASVVGLRIIF